MQLVLFIFQPKTGTSLVLTLPQGSLSVGADEATGPFSESRGTAPVVANEGGAERLSSKVKDGDGSAAQSAGAAASGLASSSASQRRPPSATARWLWFGQVHVAAEDVMLGAGGGRPAYQVYAAEDVYQAHRTLGLCMDPGAPLLCLSPGVGLICKPNTHNHGRRERGSFGGDGPPRKYYQGGRFSRRIRIRDHGTRDALLSGSSDVV